LERKLKNKFSKNLFVALLIINVKIKNDYQYQKLNNEEQ